MEVIGGNTLITRQCGGYWWQHTGSLHVKWTNFRNHPTSTSPLLIKFYHLLQIRFKLDSVKFQLQIMNGWCRMFTNVEAKFVAARLFTINSKVSSYFLGQPNKLEAEKCGVPTSFGVLNAIIILPRLKMCPNLYYACPKQHKYFLMPIFMAY